MKNRINIEEMKNVTIKMVGDTIKSIMALANNAIGSFFYKPTLIQLQVRHELRKHGEPRKLGDLSKYNFDHKGDGQSYRK